MSRRIAFRIWDHREQGYINEPYYAISPSGTVMLGAHTAIEQKRYTIEQFTGLQDRDGKDIYEGDIILWDGVGIHRALVLYTETEGAWTTQYRDDEEPDLLGDIATYSEVIGNVHQHPDLLKP